MKSSCVMTVNSGNGTPDSSLKRESVFINLGRDAVVTYDGSDGRLTVKGPNCDQVVKHVDSFSIVSEK